MRQAVGLSSCMVWQEAVGLSGRMPLRSAVGLSRKLLAMAVCKCGISERTALCQKAVRSCCERATVRVAVRHGMGVAVCRDCRQSV